MLPEHNKKSSSTESQAFKRNILLSPLFSPLAAELPELDPLGPLPRVCFKILPRLYPSIYWIWLLLKQPRRRRRINSTVSKLAMPSSIMAIATRMGARPSPATQWTAMVGGAASSSSSLAEGEELRRTMRVSTSCNQFLMMLTGG